MLSPAIMVPDFPLLIDIATLSALLCSRKLLHRNHFIYYRSDFAHGLLWKAF